MTKSNNFVRFLVTTAIGGVLFLLPLIVVGILVGHVVPIVLSIAHALDKVLPDAIKTIGGISVLILLSVGILLLLCFAAGMLARASLSRRVSDAFEKKLVLLFPRYAIIRDQMVDSLGGEHAQPQMKPVIVQLDGMKRIAFETERSDKHRTVTVYLPGSPDPWAGSVALFPADQVEPLEADFRKAVATCEQMGRGTAQLINQSSGR